MLTTKDIRIRDPFILAYNHLYYMYGTNKDWCTEDILYVYTSGDLENWSGPVEIFSLGGETWAKGELWAPEVYHYKDKFYMFVSLMGNHGFRGTQVLVSDAPSGPFKAVSNKPVTPFHKSCIDGSLYVEKDVPYVVYSADWPDNYDEEKKCYVGEIWAQELTKDLSEPVGEAFRLFKSDEASVSAKAPSLTDYMGKTVERYGSDGPFVTVLNSGKLFLTWSPMPNNNYIVAAAISEKGIRGPWKHIDTMFENNGGHAMFFTDFQGRKQICMHYPEHEPYERALFLPVEEVGGVLTIQEK